jgi:ergothioneine biosynthesis protein EgtB
MSGVNRMPVSSARGATEERKSGSAPGSRASRLAARYRSARLVSERLAEPLSPEDCQVQSMPDASPVKWHLAHTTWFFETFVLKPHAAAYEEYHPRFSFLFNSYYNAVGARHPRPSRGLLSRPALEDVHAYRAAIDRAMDALLASASDAVPQEVAHLIELGINHEQQHQELILTDIKHLLAQNPLKPAYREDAAPSEHVAPLPLDWVTFPGGVRWIGHEGAGFCFDNEQPRHRAYVDAFQIGTRLVTCGEFRAFIAAGGYRRPELWLSDGWNAATAQGWDAPLYWERNEGSWWQMTLGGMRAVCDAEPVCHVSFYEADAFARWSGARLPTEAEWETAASPLETHGNFLEEDRLQPRAAQQASGLAQCFGDVWEWTRSPYTPYPGSQPEAGALGEYNAKFMCNQIVLRGGSCATPRSHIRVTYRNFFPPEARWQFSGIRLAKDA